MPWDICGSCLAGCRNTIWAGNCYGSLSESYSALDYIAPPFSWVSRRGEALWLSDYNPNSRHGFDHRDAIKITDATCFPHSDSRNLMGKVTSGFLQAQSRTARARFQGFNSPTTTRSRIAAFWLVTMKSSASQLTLQMTHGYLSIQCCVASACFHTFTSEEPMRKA